MASMLSRPLTCEPLHLIHNSQPGHYLIWPVSLIVSLDFPDYTERARRQAIILTNNDGVHWRM